jgi:hypothetical protein
MLPLFRYTSGTVPPDQQLLLAFVVHQTVEQARYRKGVPRGARQASPYCTRIEHPLAFLLRPNSTNTFVVVPLVTGVT